MTLPGDRAPDESPSDERFVFAGDESVQPEVSPQGIGSAAVDPLVHDHHATEGGRRRIALSTAFFSVATGLSRVMGLVREIVAASRFGVEPRMSAFTIAFAIPNVVRSLFADAAIQAAFVPVFSELLVKGKAGRKEAFQLASSLLYLIILGLGAMTVIFIFVVPFIVPIFTPGWGPSLRDLTVSLSQVLFPIVVLLGVTGLFAGILNSFDHFAVPALAPILWNLAIILALVFAVPALPEDQQIYAYAGGVVVGTVLQLLLPLPWLARTGFRLSLRPHLRDPRVKQVLKLMLPVTLALGLINFNSLIDGLFATFISEEAPAAIDKAFRIYMLPQGMFSVAVATVLFPSLSRMAARQDWRGLIGVVASGNRQIALLLVPAAAVMLVLSEPIVRVIYQRGAFDPAQTELVSQALFYFSFSLPFAGVNLMLTRAFFSIQHPWVPTTVAIGNLAVNAGLDALLYPIMGIGGIPLSTAGVSIITSILLAAMLRHRLGSLQSRATLVAAAKIVLSSAVAGAASWVVWSAVDGTLGTGFVAALVGLIAALAAALVAYVAGVLLLRVHEAAEVASMVRRRLSGAGRRGT